MHIRRYEARDRAAVREIASDTADCGEPVENFFPDREVFADVLTRYYTDIDSSASWVAENDGRVVGYLNGCFDTRRFLRVVKWQVIPAAFVKALWRGSLWDRFIRVNLRLSSHRSFNRQQILKNYPAHLHLNLRREGRRQGTGRKLLEQFLRQATDAGVGGVLLGVAETNVKGRRFFEKFGFIELGRESRFRDPGKPDVPAFTIIYGKRLQCLVGSSHDSTSTVPG